jgi:CheY-like chemotaxis protein
MAKKKILIADDAKNINNILKFTFEQRGHEVIQAEDGATALKLIKQHMPDIALLDVMMPEKTGIEICVELKEDSRYRHIPIVLITAISQGSGRSDDYWRDKAHADGFISKPFKIRDVADMVEKILGVAPSQSPPKP